MDDLLEAVVAISSGLDLESTLRRIVAAGTRLEWRVRCSIQT
ncbi:MAG: hypothetical protein ACRDPY_32405 [Streptosporangiaceae bacterium]